MNVPRRLIGKTVQITWMDPCEARLAMDAFKVGRAALATWVEYGLVQDITDNIVVVAHSVSRKAGTPENSAPDELSYTAIPEVLIEKVVVYEPVKEG